jgi:hypothetical protein
VICPVGTIGRVSGNIAESLRLFNNVLLIESYHIRLSHSVESVMAGILHRYIRQIMLNI